MNSPPDTATAHSLKASDSIAELGSTFSSLEERIAATLAAADEQRAQERAADLAAAAEQRADNMAAADSRRAQERAADKAAARAEAESLCA